MKQHITEEQLGELSEKGMEKWFDFLWNTVLKKDTFRGTTNSEIIELTTIGQMIEFLDENEIWFQKDEKSWDVWVQYQGAYTKKELCDALWEAVKEVLNDKV